MEQHAIPRQVTTFEFKLIGFMTLKQFLILAVFGIVALLIYFIFQGHIIGIMLAILIFGAGATVALLPIQDRHLDEWARLLLQGLNSQTQYLYDKRNQNKTLHFLHDLYFTEDPHIVMAHIESKEKLGAYLKAQKEQKQPNKKKQHVQTLVNSSTKQLQAQQFQASTGPQTPQQAQPQTQRQPVAGAQPAAPGQQSPPSGPQTPLQPGPQTPAGAPAQRQAAPRAAAHQQMKHPFFTGLIKNNRRIPLPGILVYIKDAQNNPIRILKTNPHGVFATYSPLPPGTYVVEIKDPNEQYFFDRMNIDVGTSNPTPYEFQSKEML